MQYESKCPHGCYFEPVHTKTAKRLQKIQTGKRQRISENDLRMQYGYLLRDVDNRIQFDNFITIPWPSVDFLVSRIPVTWQVGTHQRHRRQMKLPLHRRGAIVSCQHPKLPKITLGVLSEDKSLDSPWPCVRKNAPVWISWSFWFLCRNLVSMVLIPKNSCRQFF
jgi:hypothetical protein